MNSGEPWDSTDVQKLLGRIFSSRKFAHAHILKRILGYLVEHSNNANRPAPKEYEIATEAMGRPSTFDPRIDPIVRVSVASIRDRLLAYFATEGKQERLRISIPKGRYLAVVTAAGSLAKSAPANVSVSPIVRFWKPYLAAHTTNMIVYTEPLFFRDDHNHYFRDWHVNDLPSGPEALGKRIPFEGVGPMFPSFHYLSAGEVHCLLSITRIFHEMGIPIETRNSRLSSWNELSNANLILLGSPRTNHFLSTLQTDEPFVIDTHRIYNSNPQPGEVAVYQGRRYQDGGLMRMVEYVLVTRRSGLMPGCAITMIAANHGRAIEGAGHCLTVEDRVQSMIETMGLPNAGEMPPHFQMLMRVETIDVDDEVIDVQCVAHRTHSDGEKV